MSVFHQNILAGASGAAGGAAGALYVDDVFSCFAYEGDGASSRSVQNGLDLSGEGGLVWFKARDQTYDNALFDTERGTNQRFNSNAQGASQTETTTVTAFDSDGFTVGSNVYVNGSGTDYVSWSFRKAPGFFDVVSYTGNGTAGRTVSHSLGSTPGMMIIKKSNNSENWIVYHRSVGATKFMTLNGSGAPSTSSVIFNNTEPTSTEFTLGANSQVNENGDTYIAYVFAHDDQSFGDDSDEAIIKCGTFTISGSGTFSENLGFEPQYLMMKQISGGMSTPNWYIHDNMRGLMTRHFNPLKADTNGAEVSNSYYSTEGLLKLTSQGFESTNSAHNAGNYVYIAIRRPHKPPTAGTDVFAVSAAAGNSNITTNFPVDLAFQLRRTAGSRAALTRLQGPATLETRNTSAETVNANAWYASSTKFLNAGLFTADSAFHLFKRAPGFMDIVAYTGDGASSRNVTHNLGSAAELIIVKRRNTTSNWTVWSEGLTNNYILQLNGTDAEIAVGTGYINSSTSTTFNIGNDSDVNASGSTYIAYLFDTLAGISKVGTYTGSNSTTNVDCGFSSGARFVLIRRFSPQFTTNNWHVFDTARGIVSGNDPFLYLNSNSAENSSNDYIDPLSSGFSLPGGNPEINTSGSTYLFLAIA